MKNLIKKWHNKSVEDWGAVNSDDSRNFSKDFKKTIKSIESISLEKFNIGHYGVSGFVSKDNKYAYFSYSIPRGGTPIDAYDKGFLNGILIRTAESTSDYTGGINCFTNFVDLEEDLLALLDFM